MAAPLVNAYKVDFFRRRCIETVLGGMRLPQRKAPFYVYTSQVFFFLLPAILGVTVAYLAPRDILCRQLVVGGVMAGLVIILQTLATLVRRREAYHASQLGLSFSVPSSMMTEEDEVEFNGFLTTSTIDFLLPPRSSPVHHLLHILLSGVLCGYSMRYLDPDDLEDRHGSTLQVVFFACGWLTMCVMQYSLTSHAPPEPNQYRAHDRLGLTGFTRPFYVFVFMGIDFAARHASSYPFLEDINSVCHVGFIVLPIAWAIGLLPQVDVLVLWLAERALVVGLGGSSVASDLRLMWNLFLAVAAAGATFAAYWWISHVSALGCALGLGYFLASEPGTHPKRWPLAQWLRTLVAIGACVAGFIPYLLDHEYDGQAVSILTKKDSAVNDLETVLEIAISSAFVMWWFTFWVRKPRWLPLGMIENPLFERGGKAVSLHRWLGGILQCLPLAYLFFFLEDASQRSILRLLAEAALVLRAFRWTFQRTQNALADLILVIWLPRSGILPSWLEDAGLGLKFALASVVLQFVQELVAKLHLIVATLTALLTDTKCRPKSTRWILAGNVLLFPLVLAAAVVASVLSTPLLPLFGVPLFLIGFPRPRRVWPTINTSPSTHGDGIYYHQLVPEVKRILPNLWARGSLGNLEVGSFYLLRLESRVMILQVLERGSGFVNITLKGLELQETSCHHQEATNVDDMFDQVFAPKHATLKRPFVERVMGVVHPRTHAPVDAYTTQVASLAGIIDHPDNLRMMPETFFRTLVWTFVQHNHTSSPPPIASIELPEWAPAFPSHWYGHLVGDDDPIAGSVALMAGPEDPVVALCMACFAAIYGWGLGGHASAVAAGPGHVLNVYRGNVPPSLHSSWLTDQPNLVRDVIRAYRYAFKLVYDKAVLGVPESLDDCEQLESTLREYDEKWHIGIPDGDFQASMATQRECIMTLYHENNKYKSQFLALRKGQLQIAKLEEEIVRGNWASLVWELLYVTNDDDERYSIQASPLLLRNMLVQCAEPPLGYPVYSTGPMVVFL